MFYFKSCDIDSKSDLFPSKPLKFFVEKKLGFRFLLPPKCFLNKTNTGTYLNSGTNVPGVPFIANYHEHLNAIYGHTVLLIGSAQSDYWWFFKTYWDIVVTWHSNFDAETLELNKKNRVSPSSRPSISNRRISSMQKLCRFNAIQLVFISFFCFFMCCS